MSYPPPPPYSAPPPPVPGQAPRPPRPQTVTLAGAILVGEAVLLLIGAVASVLFADTIKKASDDYIAAHGGASSSANFGTNEAFGIIFGVIFAAILVGLALGNLRGVNAIRIITWVVSGLIVCCVGFSTIGSAAVLGKYLPGGYLAYTYIVNLLELVGFIAVIVLLALRPSNAYFNPKSQQQPF
jgi:hypothetical protein